MNTKARLKMVFFAMFVAVAAPVGLASITLLTSFIASFQQGADPASIFHSHSLAIPTAYEAQWLSLPQHIDMQPSQAEQEAIISAYWLAWEAIEQAYATRDTSDLKTYWAGSAYQSILTNMDSDERLSLGQTHHQLHLRFFSADGTVAAFQDEGFKILQTVSSLSFKLEASASVVMTLDQGFWRVRYITLQYK